MRLLLTTVILLATVILWITINTIRAEDWTTTDGKSYQDITVVKVEDDAVTILDKDGGALVPLAVLPPELQKKFHYDAAKAKAAADKRASEEQASIDAITQAKKDAQAKAANRVVATTPAPSTPAPAAVASTPAPTPPPLSLNVPSSTSASTPSTSSSSSNSGANGGQFALNKGTADESASAGHETPNPNWKLVWSDDFDGPNIDTSKWGFEIDGKGGGNGEKEYYTAQPENAHIKEGMLYITAIKDGKDAEGRTHPFTSSRMTTKGKFFQQYGRFEARIKMPHGQGVWPAFWLMPEDSAYGGWASSGEIDITELIGKSDNTTNGTIHYGDKWPKNVHTGDKLALPSGIMADDFHIFSVEWEEGVIRWYFDNKLYQTQTKWYTKAAPFPAPFNKPFFVILNFAVGGAWPGPPGADTPFPQDMIVDYVHVYSPN